MRPTLKQLQYLVAIAETGTYGEAAKRVNISQSSLSTQINDLEAELGTVVFERGRHGAIVTPIGKDVLAQSRLILREVEALRTLARQSDQGLEGRINLGVLPSIGPYLLPPAVRSLHQSYPGLRLWVREGRTPTLDAMLKDGRIDVILSSANDHPDCDFEFLFNEDLWICAAPTHPLSQSDDPIKLKDLSTDPLLSLGSGHRLSSIVRALADEAGTLVSSEYEGTSLDAVRQMAVMGAGIAVLPSLYVRSEAQRDPEFSARRIDHPRARRAISLIWRRSSRLERRYKTLAATLRDTANEVLNKKA